MLTDFLIKNFIKNYEETKDTNVRKGYGFLGSIVGIIVNILLFIGKFGAGILVNSVSIMADSFNNLSDVFSSVITLGGFILAGKPADEEHPFGHGRIEYIAGLIVSFLIILIGYEFIKTSIDRILNPQPVNFNSTALLILLIAIGAKGWLALFNRVLAKTINSQALHATSVDSISDAISSSCVALGLLVSRWTDLPLDGYIGVVVAGIILYSGFSQVKETISPLLGESSHGELSKVLVENIFNYEGILNVHDLIIHSYGPGRYMVSIHAEVPANKDIMDLHELIDRVEREISNKMDIVLTIHMDPVNMDCQEISSLRTELDQMIKDITEIVSYHDLRIVGKGEVKNVLFDIVVKPGMGVEEQDKLRHHMTHEINKIHPHYACIITVDKEYVQM